MGKLWITQEAYEQLIHLTSSRGISYWKASTLNQLHLMHSLGMYVHLERDYEPSEWLKLIEETKKANYSILKHGRV